MVSGPGARSASSRRRRRPRLQLDDVPFGVGHVDEGDRSSSWYWNRDDLAVPPTSGSQYLIPGLLNILDLEGQVTESRAVDGGLSATTGRVVLEELQGGTSLTVTWKAKVSAPQMGALDAGGAIQPGT